MESEKIKAIIDNVLSVRKTLDKKTYSVNKETPEYYSGWAVMVKQANDIKHHAVVGKFPERLFAEAAPNQTKKEYDYSKKVYRQITLPVFLDLISSLQRPLNDKNWSIEYKEDDKQYKDFTLQDYLENDLPVYKSIESFLKNVLPPIKTIDANGVIVVKPYGMYDAYEKAEDKKEENETDVESELLEPYPVYYPIESILAYKEDEYLMVETKEKSLVEFGGQKKRDGLVFEFYDENSIYVIKQVGKKQDYEFEIIEYLKHDWDRLPVIKNMGVPVMDGEVMHYQSPFIYSVPLLDNAALFATYVNVSSISCVYPHKVMIGNVCSFEDDNHNKCLDGQIYDHDTKKYYTCPACEGIGIKDRTSRLGTILLKPRTREDEGESNFSNAPLQFISPETNALEFLEEKVDKDLMKARQILHLHTNNSNVKGSEDMTATGMALDLKAMYAFLQPQIYQLFEILEFTIDAIGWQRYGEYYKKPVINYPQFFDFVTEEDTMQQLSNAMKNGLPPQLTRMYIERFLRSMYFSEVEQGKIVEIIMAADRLLPFNSDDIRLKEGRGTIENWEIVLHDSGIHFIKELIDEDEGYLDLPKEEQIKKLKDKAKGALPKNKADVLLDEIANSKQQTA
jgi:hypothetical protein